MNIIKQTLTATINIQGGPCALFQGQETILSLCDYSGLSRGGQIPVSESDAHLIYYV